MVEFEYVGDGGEAREEVLYLLEVRAELYEGHRREGALRRHLESAGSQGVEVAHAEQQVGARLHGEEPRARHLDCQRGLEAADGSARRGLELDHVRSVLQGLKSHIHETIIHTYAFLHIHSCIYILAFTFLHLLLGILV